MPADGRLTTHVLDTARGRPAAGLALALYRVDGEAREELARVTTNADGRTDAPLLAGAAFAPGLYEIVFAVGPYFGGESFYDAVPVRFRLGAGGHFHVPLLVSPYGYSTYRGS